MNKKKIVFMINSLNGGGAERVIVTLLNHFVKFYECYLIVLEDDIAYEIDSRVNIIYLNENSNINLFVKFLRLPLVSFKLAKIIKQNNFNTVVSFLHRSNYANIISKFFTPHKAIISERTNFNILYKEYFWQYNISKFLVKTLYQKADDIIVVSKYVKENLVLNYEVKTNPVVIYNPYDLIRINKLQKESSTIDTDYKYNLISVGNFYKIKNHALIIDMLFKLESKYHLYLLGIGPEENILKEKVKKLKLEKRVHFLGFDQNPYKHMIKCERFILASNCEGFPNVLAEAILCGCTVISTDCLSGPREILAPETNYKNKLVTNIEIGFNYILVPTDNIEKLYEAVLYSIEDLKFSTSKKDNVNDFIRSLSVEKVADRYEKIIFSNIN